MIFATLKNFSELKDFSGNNISFHPKLKDFSVKSKGFGNPSVLETAKSEGKNQC